MTNHAAETATLKSPIAKAIRRTIETFWRDLWTARGTSSSSVPDVVSMNPRNTRSNPARVAEASTSAVITSWWLMPPRLHSGCASVHPDERIAPERDRESVHVSDVRWMARPTCSPPAAGGHLEQRVRIGG